MSKGNFKVLCIKSDGRWLTKGKVYEFKNGHTVFDNGHVSVHPYDNSESFFTTHRDWVDCLVDYPSGQSIHIYRKDRDTIATLKTGKQTVKSAKATCNPSDEFDFEIGAKFALARLFNPSIKYLEIETIKINQSDTTTSFDWSEFKSGKFAVHCDTEEKAKEFLKECDEQGIKWSNGAKASSRTYWNENREKTHYQFYVYLDSTVDHGICYGNNSSDIKSIDYTPSKPTVKEVKRPVKVGEWIKVVNAMPCKSWLQKYTSGDIFKCTKTNACASGDILVDGVNDFIDYTEYVVLENYQPEESAPEPTKTLSDYTINELLTEIERRCNK